jgi:hypothetical protein
MNTTPLRCHNCTWQRLVVLCIAICVGVPSRLTASDTSGNYPKLTWSLHGGEPKGIVVERRIESRPEDGALWERIAKLGNTATEYTDPGVAKVHRGLSCTCVH